MSRSKKLNVSNDLVLKAIIICDDFAFVAQANAALQRVGCRPNVKVQWNVRSWPLNVLRQSTTAKKAFGEAADAHLIVIPARHAHSPPLCLRDFLDRWAGRRRIHDAALAVMVDGIDAGVANTVSPVLALLVRKHGLNFIGGEGAACESAAKPLARLPGERYPARQPRDRMLKEAGRAKARFI
jgi:hypothetical protein